MAELSGSWFPVAFVGGAIIAAFSSYAYVKMSNAYPSAGGIGMYLVKAYGKRPVAAFAALLMAFAMIINQSLTARTFGTYTLQLFDVQQNTVWAPLLGVLLLLSIFLINLAAIRPSKNLLRNGSGQSRWHCHFCHRWLVGSGI